MPIKFIFFDLDETLIADHQSTQTALKSCHDLAEASSGQSISSFSEVALEIIKDKFQHCTFKKYFDEIGISPYELLWWNARNDLFSPKRVIECALNFRREVWREIGLNLKLKEHYEALENCFIEGKRASLSLFIDAEPALSSLSQSYELGLITNGASSLQREKISIAGIGHFFKVICISGEVGKGKPDLAIFNEALKQSGVLPQEAIMIGDKIGNDFNASTRAGMTPLLVARDNVTSNPHRNIGSTISSLSELL